MSNACELCVGGTAPPRVQVEEGQPRGLDVGPADTYVARTWHVCKLVGAVNSFWYDI
jgi:hypothetical protein